MSEPFIAEIRIFGFNFAPDGWAFCDGTLLPIAQYTALFALIGTTYGGDGRATVGLPDLRGRASMHPGNGPGLSPRSLGQRGGETTATLSAAQMASHTHAIQASTEFADLQNPTPDRVIARSQNAAGYAPAGALEPMSDEAAAETGGGQEHNNLQPYLVLNFCIALVGTFPSRS